jgi:hypothetical protein
MLTQAESGSAGRDGSWPRAMVPRRSPGLNLIRLSQLEEFKLSPEGAQNTAEMVIASPDFTSSRRVND